MSVCLFEIPDEDIKVNALELWSSEYGSRDVWLLDLEENRIDLNWSQLRALATWVLKVDAP